MGIRFGHGDDFRIHMRILDGRVLGWFVADMRMIWDDMIWGDMTWYDMGWCEDVLQFCSSGWWIYSWSTTQDMSVIDIGIIFWHVATCEWEKRTIWGNENMNEIRTIWENAKLKEDDMRKCGIKRGCYEEMQKRGWCEEIQN